MREIRLVRGFDKSDKVEKGELKKPESRLQKLDKHLERVEKKTDNLIEKSQKKEAPQSIAEPTLNNSLNIAKASPNHSLKNNDASYMNFLLMTGLKKLVLKHIQENMYEEDEQTYSVIDTEEIKKQTSSDSNIIRDTIYKLKKDDWFETVQQHYSKRIIKISKINYTKF